MQGRFVASKSSNVLSVSNGINMLYHDAFLGEA